MNNPRDMETSGPFEARYLAFLETITQLRPRLHRYCSRMTGRDSHFHPRTKRKQTLGTPAAISNVLARAGSVERKKYSKLLHFYYTWLFFAVGQTRNAIADFRLIG